MRQERAIQTSIFDLFAGHEIGRELKAMSNWLDEHPALVGLVVKDLRRCGVKETGRQGLPAELALRCALLKQHRQLSYEELAFHLEDSASFRAFARLPLSWTPKKSVLHKTIGAIRAETWEAINRPVLYCARKKKVETGSVIRLDSTVTAALMHEPSDSGLLWDGVRVMVRLLKQADALAAASLPGATAAVRQRNERALSSMFAASLNGFSSIVSWSTAIAQDKSRSSPSGSTAGKAGGAAKRVWRAKASHYRPFIERIIAQSERRVLQGEQVPAGEKIVSLFEPHADIIVKGGRDTGYGHKLNLVTGRSGLVLDVVIEAGNPADSDRLLPMLERHIAFYGQAPRQAAADGGFASHANLDKAKARGVSDMAFHKKCGLRIEDMVRSRWVYRKLRNFRAGIEAGISCLKRAYGLARCTWRGLEHFKAYVWSSVVAYNLALFARLKPT